MLGSSALVSVRAVMTYLSVMIDLLMSMDSLVAVVPVYDCRSDPAKSTSCNVETTVLSGLR